MVNLMTRSLSHHHVSINKRNRRRNRPRIEVLESRSLLAVTFTGNVAVDFPAGSPGIAILADGPFVRHPDIPADLKDVVKVSGFDISGIRLGYSPVDDTLSIGLEQPDNQKTGRPVIAGDADNNGNGGTVSPGVLELRPPSLGSEFIDYENLGGYETMSAILDLNNDGTPDIVAGVLNSRAADSSGYVVARTIASPTSTSTLPDIGELLPAFVGSHFLANDPAHPNFEFSISHFSQLFLAITGKALVENTPIAVGAFGSSLEDDGIGEAFFPASRVTLTITPLTAPSTSAGFFGVDPAKDGVYNKPYRFIGKVYAFWKNGDVRYGTGALIGPSQVLTAAHVLYNIVTKESPFFVIFTPGEYFGKSPVGSANATKWVVAKAYLNGDRYVDYAVIKLNKALGSRTGGWFSLSDWLPNTSYNAVVAGYSEAFDGGKSIVQGSDTLATASRRPEIRWYLSTLNQMGVRTGGLSGAPAWTYQNGKYRIIGIYTGVDNYLVNLKLFSIDIYYQNVGLKLIRQIRESILEYISRNP